MFIAVTTASSFLSPSSQTRVQERRRRGDKLAENLGKTQAGKEEGRRGGGGGGGGEATVSIMGRGGGRERQMAPSGP